jgi:hypothetical protein
MLQMDFQDQIFNADGFVAKKFSQLKVLILIKDYPFVAQMELIKIVLVVVTIQDLHVHQMPIKIVYLNGNLSKNICR